MQEKKKLTHAIKGASVKLKKALDNINNAPDSAERAEEVERLAVDIITLCAQYRAITEEDQTP